MKINNSERKLNNKGFTLMELIVVVAIMIVMAGAAAVTVSMLDSSYVEDAERGIKDYISMARTKSMSVSAKDWYVSITKEGNEYYANLYKVTVEIVASGGVDTEVTKVTLIEKQKLGAKITISFRSEDGTVTNLDASNNLELHFDSATGKVNLVKLGAATPGIGSGIGSIGIKRNDYAINLKVFYNTGKCERE